MAKEYKVGEKYYLPVTVESVADGTYGVTIGFDDGAGEDTTLICNDPDLLLTDKEICEKRLGKVFEENYPTFTELKATVAKLKAENAEWKHNEQAYHEATEKLEAERDNLKSQVGKNLAEIQNLTSKVHFHKEFGEGVAKQEKELQARYDELDSVNREQAEKIRKLDKALTDLKQRNDKLQAEIRIEAQQEKEAARRVHVITNNGKEYVFRRCTKASFDNYGNFTVLKLYEGVTYVGGFLRGDSPDNFAAWWTE